MENRRQFLIAHFHPVELYPPCLNMIGTFVKRGFSGVLVSSSKGQQKMNIDFGSQVRSIRTHPYTTPPNPIASVFSYFDFAMNVRLELKSNEFDVFLIYEAVSYYLAMPRFWNNKMFVALHFHEYRSMKESKKTSKFERVADSWTSGRLNRLDWVSHATELRAEAYSEDHSVYVNTLHNFPNFRPIRKIRLKRGNSQFRIRIVFLGTIDLTHPVLQKIRDCVLSSKNMEMTFIGSINENDIPQHWTSPMFHFPGRINYDEIAGKLNEYDIGVIHYAAHSDNFKLGVPNKFFEYQYAQLPVLYDASMRGIEHFIKNRLSWDFCSEAIDFQNVSLDALASEIKKLSDKGREWQGLQDSVIITADEENDQLFDALDKWCNK